MNWVIALAWVVARLKEPSSYAGLGVMLAAAHLCTDCSGLSAAIVPVLMALAGLVGFILNESGNG